MRYLTLALALLFTLTITQSQPLLAQDSTDDDGGGSFISNLLEKSLSGDNRNVRVVGLSGALSSSATIQQIIISDDEGPWLTISNAQLDWARAALLRGNLRINKLSAETIELSRAPGTTTTEEDLPSPEATPFQIPELPVAVNIGELSVGTLTLGEPVIGVAASLTINGKLVLEDGSLDTTMAVTRLDRPGDEIDLTAGFSNATRQLTLDLSVTEDAGGLVSELMKIPDRPSVRLTAKGDGPVTDFTADLSLATDGTERVTGQVSLAGDGAGGDIDFAAQMDGDLTPLLAEPYREFFGTSSQLRLDGSNGTESGLEISKFSLAASALDLSGSAKIGPDGTLQNVALDGSISPPEGETVTLPTGDPVTEITSATIKGGFDAAEGNSWQLTADIRGMSRVDISFDRVELTAEGTLEQGANTHLAGTLTAGLTGLTFPEEQLREAVGETLDLDGSFDWNNGALTLDGFELTGTDYAARLSVLIDGLDTGFNIGGTAEVEAQDLGHVDVAVVGGGPAGAAAAVYAARKGLKTVIITDRLGGQLQDTKGIENLISVPYTEGPDLSNKLGEHLAVYDIDLLNHRRVASVAPGGPGEPVALTLESGDTLATDALIVATGAKWRELGVPGEKEYLGRGVAFCPHCDGPMFKGKDIAVVGGGNSGVEAALDLAGIVRSVKVLEFMDEAKADAVLLDKLAALPNAELITSAKTLTIDGNDEGVTGLSYEDRASGEAHSLALDGVFVQIGLVPNSGFLGDLVATNRYGEIEIDGKCRTNQPGIYAAGDVTTVPYKQIVVAIGEGAKAALAAYEDRLTA